MCVCFCVSFFFGLVWLLFICLSFVCYTVYPFKVNISSLQGLEHVINLLLLLTGVDAPVIDKSPETSKAACETGQTASLVCRAEGAPNITFAWFKVRFLQALVTESLIVVYVGVC